MKLELHLVISGSAEDKTAQYLAIDKLIKQLNNKDYEIDEKDKKYSFN